VTVPVILERVAGNTAPRPFVFVLMPFDPDFDEFYKYGIKETAHEVGAYAERVDEQDYAEGILDRIFNQINKADVVIADMSGKNANVFYEVGYAHALNKLVILVTQNADDIPFDLKHRQHLVYKGRIDELRKGLAPKLRWAISEAAQRRADVPHDEYFTVYLGDQQLAPAATNARVTVTCTAVEHESSKATEVMLRLAIRNDSDEESPAVRHAYLFAPRKAAVFPVTLLGVTEHFTAPQAFYSRLPVPARPEDAYDGLNDLYHMKGEVPPLPPGGVEMTSVVFALKGDKPGSPTPFRLRLHTRSRIHDFPFELAITQSRFWRPRKSRIGG
jgi:Nucleoside 2-deoxyribosyltransferase